MTIDLCELLARLRADISWSTREIYLPLHRDDLDDDDDNDLLVNKRNNNLTITVGSGSHLMP